MLNQAQKRPCVDKCPGPDRYMKLRRNWKYVEVSGGTLGLLYPVSAAARSYERAYPPEIRK
jgi:hypothetical protein